MKRSLSGETVRVMTGVTLKSGSHAVAAQGRVMREIRQYHKMAVPRIYYVGDTWYAMQTIVSSLGPDSGIRKWSWRRAASAMEPYWYLPEKWFYPRAPMFDAGQLLRYVQDMNWYTRISVPTIRHLRAKYDSAQYLTHGDLTNENTIINLQGDYKLIDWQASRHAYIPAHRDVDYGKLVQSLLGWTKPVDENDDFDDDTEKALFEVMQVSPMSFFWAAIHYMRIQARATEQWQKDMCASNIEYLDYLLEKEGVI